MDETRMEVGGTTAWEREVGYRRVVRTGAHVFVSGTLGIGGDGKVVAPGDAYRQGRRALERMQEELSEVGASLDDVVRTRIFVTDIGQWQDVARAHREAFPRNHPASTLVEVSRLVDEQAVVEIEADAYLGKTRHTGGAHLTA